jgi:hypothetical protein
MKPESSPSPEESNQEFNSRDVVRIVRSDGTPELDWQVSETVEEGVVVFKNIPAGKDSAGKEVVKTLTKIIPVEELKRWQKTMEIGGRKIGPGEKVNVYRSSGEFEHDWELVDFNDHDALVAKEGTKKGEKVKLTKLIPLADFEEWQIDDRAPGLRTIKGEDFPDAETLK